MTSILIPQLVTAAVPLAVIIYSSRRAITETNEQTRRYLDEIAAETARVVAEVQAARSAPEQPPPGRADVRYTLTVRTASGVTADEVRRAVETGLRDHLAPDAAPSVELAAGLAP